MKISFKSETEGHPIPKKGNFCFLSYTDVGLIQTVLELKLAYPLEKILSQKHVDVAIMKKFTENLKRVYIGSTTKKLLEIFNGNILIILP